MDIVNLKPIPIGYERKAYQLNKKELKIIQDIQYIKPDPTAYAGGGRDFYLSKSGTLLENKGLTNLKNFFIQKAKEYTQDILQIKDKLYMTQSWSTVHKTDAFHPPHDHPNTFLTSVYYVQCEDGAIFFELKRSSICEAFNFQYTIDKHNVYNSQVWRMPITTGDIVLFPGQLFHGTPPNKLKQPRIILGANFFIKGVLGTGEEKSIIKI